MKLTGRADAVLPIRHVKNTVLLACSSIHVTMLRCMVRASWQIRCASSPTKVLHSLCFPRLLEWFLQVSRRLSYLEDHASQLEVSICLFEQCINLEHVRWKSKLMCLSNNSRVSYDWAWQRMADVYAEHAKHRKASLKKNFQIQMRNM